MSTAPIIVEDTFDAPADAVWKAITNADEMRQWYFDTMGEFEPTVGFETQFDVEHEDVVYPHRWKITESIPESKLAYDWSYDGIPGKSFVRWEISPTDNGTTLKITHAVTEPFPKDNPVFSREAGVEGWNYLIQNLKDFLEPPS